jgi:hypothetical protein
MGASRLSALLVAFALSGGLPLLDARAGGHEHVCRCRHAAGERCTCAVCRRAGATARRAELEKLPPCHRAAAEAALAREEREGGEDRGGPSGAPVISGCCGDPDAHRATLVSPDPFAPPPPVLLVPPAFAGRARDRDCSPRDRVRAPPRPPPRHA